jgi:hypothetical protein
MNHQQRMLRMKQRDKEVLSVASGLVPRFMEHVERTEDCWLYTPFNRLGYGSFYYRAGHKMHSHRVALLIFTGVYPERGIYYACHKCTNKNCVNPKHLYWGTPQDNAIDAWADPSHRTEEFRIACQYREKISDEQLKLIWRKFWFDGVTLDDLASEHQLSSRYLAAVMRGEYRSHVTRYLEKPEKRKVDYYAMGERNCRSVLNEKQVQAIRRLLCMGATHADLAILASVTRPTIRGIETGRVWGHLAWPEGTQPPDRQSDVLRAEPAPVRDLRGTRSRNELTEEEIAKVWRLYWWENGNQRTIAASMGIHNGLVSQIANGKWGTHVTASLTKPDTPRKRLVSSRARKPGSGNARLTEEQVQNIRRRILKGDANTPISDEMKVSIDMVRLIRNRKSWNNLEWPTLHDS